MKLLLINGPKRSGKDHAARMLEASDTIDCGVIIDRFSMPIKLAFAAMIGAGIDELGNVADYEVDKEKSIPLLGNVSYRQWQIDFSEKFMKPLYGNNIFGRLLMSRLETLRDDYPTALVVVPDCGFQIEVDHVTSNFPPEDTALFIITRQGASHEGDSRGIVTPSGGIYSVHIHNDGTQSYNDLILHETLEFLNRSPS